MSKNKKKKNISTIVAGLIFIIIGGLGGFFGGKVIDESLPSSDTPFIIILFIALIFIFACLSMYIQIIVHEAGHYIFGKLSGYDFVSFRIGTLMFVKEKNKISRRKFNIVGTGGQCLMSPPKCDGYNFPCVLYNLGGSIANIVLGLISLSLYLLLSQIPLLNVLLIMNFIFGIGFALLNSIPLKIGGIANDGFNTLSLYRNREARHMFWLQLKINALISTGTRLQEMPEEWFRLPSNADLKNPLISSIGVMQCSYLHDKKEFEQAKVACEAMLNNAPGLLHVYRNELHCELMFYEIIGQRRKEEIEKLYTKELKKYIKATASYVSRKRLMYAYELLVNKNTANAQKELIAFEKVAKTYPYQGEVESEREIIQLINSYSNS